MATLNDANRTPEEIINDIKEIKSQIRNLSMEEKIDDMTIKYKSINELKDILQMLEEELNKALGIESQRWVTGIRRGFR